MQTPKKKQKKMHKLGQKKTARERKVGVGEDSQNKNGPAAFF